MTCPYCADGTVYDLWWVNNRWQQQRIGQCKHCASGDCEPGRLIRAIAEHTGQPCVRVIFHVLLGCLEYRLKHHEQARELELTEVLKGLYPGLMLENQPPDPGLEAVSEPPAYDFGDGWESEQDGVPF